MFLGKNKEILWKHSSKDVKDIHNSAPLYIPVAGKVEELNMDVGKDLFYFYLLQI